MLLIMGSWRGADALWSGALVGLSLILGSIQAPGLWEVWGCLPYMEWVKRGGIRKST